MNSTLIANRWLVLAAFAAISACGTEAVTPATTGGGNDTATGTTDATSSDGAGAGGDVVSVDSVGNNDAGDTTTTTNNVDATVDTAVDDGSIADTAGADATITDTTHADTTAAETTDAETTDAKADASDGGSAGGPNSCVGKCGQYSGAWACQCDDFCQSVQDCCADFVATCTCGSDSDCVSPGDKCATGGCVDGVCDVKSKSCDDGNDCTTDSCDPATGACKTAAAADNTICSGDGCVEGACKSGVCAPGGNKANGTFCTDANKCTFFDQCTEGVCGGENLDCDDLNPCTTDACAPDSGCSNVDVTDGVACDDEEDCTEGDKCVTGDCKGTNKGETSPCDDGDGCSLNDVCKNGYCEGTPANGETLCDDEKLCTNGDACANGFCQGTAKNCDDGKNCTLDVCDSATGGCVSKPVSEGSSCNDGDPCTTSDTCIAETCIGLQPKCNDNKPCTADACDNVDGVGKCTYTPIANGGTCQDGDACTIGDSCTAGACIAGVDKCITATWTEAFACGVETGWVLNPKFAPGTSAWNVDDKPNPPGFKSAPCSLNFNNDIDFDDGHVLGTATSAGVALPSDATLVFVAWSYADVESSATYDARTLQISTDDFQTVAVAKKLDNAANLKKWEKISINLSAFAGKTVKVRFAFDSVDSVSNNGAGWFIDDLSVFKIAP